MTTARELEQSGQFSDDLWFLGVAIDLLCWIVAQMVELSSGSVCWRIVTAKAARAFAEDQLPVSLSDGKETIAGMMNQMVVNWPMRFLALERSQDVETILGAFFGERMTHQGGKGTHQIGQDDWLIGDFSRGSSAGPAHDERHPVTRLPGIRFHAAPGSRWIVSELFHRTDGSTHVDAVSLRRSVVTGKDDKGALSGTGSIECRKNLTQHPVDLMYEISVNSRLALAGKVWRRGDGGMRSSQWNVEKERLLGVLCAFLDEGGRLLGQSWQHH